MPLAQLNSIPRSSRDLAGWQFANTSSHRDIIRRVQETLGVELVEYPLQPFDPEDSASLQAFLNAHQTMHSQMDTTLGLNSYNLSEVDWSDRNALSQWIGAHYIEHQAASALLGVG
jgi:hypothetical protein